MEMIEHKHTFTVLFVQLSAFVEFEGVEESVVFFLTSSGCVIVSESVFTVGVTIYQVMQLILFTNITQTHFSKQVWFCTYSVWTAVSQKDQIKVEWLKALLLTLTFVLDLPKHLIIKHEHFIKTTPCFHILSHKATVFHH